MRTLNIPHLFDCSPTCRSPPAPAVLAVLVVLVSWISQGGLEHVVPPSSVVVVWALWVVVEEEAGSQQRFWDGRTSGTELAPGLDSLLLLMGPEVGTWREELKICIRFVFQHNSRYFLKL